MATAKEKREAAAAEAAAAAAAKEAGEKTEIERLNERQFQNPGSAPIAHGDVVEKSRSGATVIVACKLGVAFFDIQLNTKNEEVFEQNMQGGRKITAWQRDGKVVRLRGTAYPRGTVPDGFGLPPIIVDGAALNFNVPKDFWEAWVDQHKLDPLVVNKFIFAHESESHVKGMAKERGDELSGLEPINPKNDKRMPKAGRAEISDITGAKAGT